MANKAITTEYLEEIVAAFNRHDLDAIGSYFAPDGRFLTARGSGAHGNELVGSAAICEYLGQRYELIPDMRWIGESHFISGNRALSDWTVQGTMQDGSKINWRGCDIWDFDENGKIRTKDTYWKLVE